MTHVLLAGVLTLSVFAQSEPARKTETRHQKPFERLFVTKPIEIDMVQTKKAPPKFAPAAKKHHQAERGACNMPVIRADGKADEKMIVPIDRRKADAKIRVIEPTVCWEK